MADAFRARVVDASTDSFVFELTGKPDKVDQFISLMVPLGLVEVARTGVAAISRGRGGSASFEAEVDDRGRGDVLDAGVARRR